MKLLIPTEPDDLHALLVQIAFEEMGHSVRLLFTADHPTKQSNSVYLDNGIYNWKSADDYSSYEENEYDVVWWRRARRPYFPKELSHPGDYKFIVRENALFHESLTANIAPNAWWINSKEAANRANLKLLQLRLASQCGLTIPKTLCSNDPNKIKMFLIDNKNQHVIYKPLCSNFWFEKDKIKMTYTNKITLSDLKESNGLQYVPGLYQTEIKKKYELRVTCFGRYLVAAQIDSQSNEGSKLDWRAMQGENLDIKPYKLPSAIESKIHRFMDKLGIVFGAFDLIVTPENEYVFLEVNEQGQFFWVEELNPEFKMLDIFIHFMLNKSSQFQWDSNHVVHSIGKYRAEMKEQLRLNMARHVFLNAATIN
ncbi:MAG: hypothetical protein WC785_05575 [Tatlockia sp.]|jgi:glutathione synthase/RimK-type ligase-like ATP-grasp enzyme